LTVTAEGIETAEQAEFLRAHGCDNLQGYYFSPPLPVDDITNWLHAESLTAIAASWGYRVVVH
jgi:EAL domain-containing protein (putative c-di-GMP-specific phosphodiesterase class I)